MADTHTQVELQKGDRFQVVWIPSYGAKRGKVLDLKLGGGLKDEGWTVTQVYGTMASDEALDRERDYTHQRKASDI